MGNQWRGDYGSWAEAVADSAGYASGDILETVRTAALRVKRGEAAYERDGVLFDTVSYSWALLAGLMWVAARRGGRLDVLDFGGALGSSFRQNRAFLEALPHVRWNVVEQPHFVAAGNRDFADEQLRFYDTIEECVTGGEPQVAVLSSVLQYLDKPYELIARLAERVPFLIIDLTPMHDGPRDRLTVQHVPATIYPARYPCWFFSAAQLASALRERYRIVAPFDSHLGQDISVGNLRASYRGFIAERLENA